MKAITDNRDMKGEWRLMCRRSKEKEIGKSDGVKTGQKRANQKMEEEWAGTGLR